MKLPKYNPFTFNLYTFDRESIKRMSPEERQELREYLCSDPEKEYQQVIDAFGELGRRMAEAQNQRFMDAFTERS